MSSSDEYLRTVERLEPDIHPIDASAFYASAAISLCRIAEAFEPYSEEGLIAAIFEKLNEIAEHSDLRTAREVLQRRADGINIFKFEREWLIQHGYAEYLE